MTQTGSYLTVVNTSGPAVRKIVFSLLQFKSPAHQITHAVDDTNGSYLTVANTSGPAVQKICGG